jgi:hypothetical protein
MGDDMKTKFKFVIDGQRPTFRTYKGDEYEDRLAQALLHAWHLSSMRVGRMVTIYEQVRKVYRHTGAIRAGNNA